jgi:hypothetical protein
MDYPERRRLFSRLERHVALRRSYSDSILALLPMRYKFTVAPAVLDSYYHHGTALALLEADNARCRQQSESLSDTAGTEQNELK